MRRAFLIFIFFVFISGCEKKEFINVLIFSGSNNHDWQLTTQFLENMYVENGFFKVAITERPDTLKEKDLSGFDVIISNWNSWPENKLRWPEDAEKALRNFIQKGGGFVTFHASTSVFYEWPEFKNISSAAWIDSTWHGKNSSTQVLVKNNEHPITRGMTGFFIYDELWVNAEKNNSFKVLGEATNVDISEKGLQNQPAVLVKEYGKGRIFHTILGHDVRTMRNIGFQTLMLRGTEWAATGKVTISLPQELQTLKSANPDYNWTKTDSSFTLLNGEKTIWKYNFFQKHEKPYFHPIYLGANNLTCVGPDDHLWHVGQWFSWKYLNGVNYWEYQNGSYQSEGVTEIKQVELIPGNDYSAEIKMKIVYHPENGENVLAEKRTISIAPPGKKGDISMDYYFEFEALADSVDINRTPIIGEPGGMSWGGYAGLSIRFNQSFMDSYFISSWGENDSINGKTGDWLFMGFKGIDGKNAGSQIMIAPETQREGSAWYSVNTEDHPFYYFSPAYLYKKPLLLLKGEKLQMQYRVKHFAGEKKFSELEKEFNEYKLNQ